MKRNQIEKRIHANQLKVDALKLANKELNRQHLLLSDKNQWYKEDYETVCRGKNKITNFVGRVYWKEKFVDEDYPNNPKAFVIIERSQAVRVNNEWINGL